MALKDTLLARGHLPENLPPPFHSEEIAKHFTARPPANFISENNRPLRAANYSASKRNMTRRTFSAIHPETSYDLAQFIHLHEGPIFEFLGRNTTSLSIPRPTPANGDRALLIDSHSKLEEEKVLKLSKHRFIVKTDISRFYHSIYTHTLPWAVHGRDAAKRDRHPSSNTIYFNRADRIIQTGQDGQTIGIPVGPDVSRIFAEVIGCGIDSVFAGKIGNRRHTLIRHVDDVWIGTDDSSTADECLWKYREAIRSFELDINELKTKIYSDDFSFADTWPTEIATRIQFAQNSDRRQIRERLTAAFEYAFSLAARSGDDGILKYLIRYIDKSDLKNSHWELIEALLMRTAVHFGHTIDYSLRVIVWRHLSHDDVDVEIWKDVLLSILDRNSRIGNDSEVSWTLYACALLNIQVPNDIAQNLINNCGALSIIAALNLVESNIVNRIAFAPALEILRQEQSTGQFWPVFLEWKSRDWPNKATLDGTSDLIEEMSVRGVTMYDTNRLPSTFAGKEENDFDAVKDAIEPRISLYDDDFDEEEDDDVPVF